MKLSLTANREKSKKSNLSNPKHKMELIQMLVPIHSLKNHQNVDYYYKAKQ